MCACTPLAFGETADEKLALQVKIISLSNETATSLCPKPNETRSKTDVEGSGEIQIDLPLLFKRLIELGGKATGKFQNTDSRGVLEGDLAGLVKSANDCRVKVFMFLTERLLGGPPPSVPSNQTIAPSIPIAGEQSESGASSPLKDGPVIRVFPKANLTQRETVALAKLLPNYSVQTGRSYIDEAEYADTLFVNRNKIHPKEVVATGRALARLGVNIKSIQQAPVGGRREIQVGTTVGGKNGGSIVEELAPIDLDRLALLDGDEFWRQSYNGGPVTCFSGLSFFRYCNMDQSARPVPRAGR
jgi:hypothetical protein